MSAIEKNPSVVITNPFCLSNDEDYLVWREHKLASYPSCIEELMVDIADLANPNQAEQRSLLSALERANLAIYRCGSQPVDKTVLRQFGRKFGLVNLDANLCADEDSITSLQAIENGRQRGYIPYTNRQLSWHTDGYYNAMAKQIRAIVMHCVTPAASGGENMYLDHEMLYLQLRDSNPDFIATLMRADVMTIPPNVENGEEIRTETVGPVFSVDDTGHLHMRYSARQRNIQWLGDSITQQATECITGLLKTSPYILRYKLKANEGVISNNVLHNRTAFEDTAQQKRLLYRARYYERARDLQAGKNQLRNG